MKYKNQTFPCWPAAVVQMRIKPNRHVPDTWDVWIKEIQMKWHF